VKHSEGLLISGAFLMCVGIAFLLLGAFPEAPQTRTATLHAGAQWTYYFAFDLQPGCKIAGTFEETAGNPVQVWVFDEPGHAAELRGDPSAALFRMGGATGAFEFTVTSPGRYYLVVTHDNATADLDQTVTLNYALVQPKTAGPAFWIVSVLGGTLQLGLAFVERFRERAEGPLAPTSIDVGFFVDGSFGESVPPP